MSATANFASFEKKLDAFLEIAKGGGGSNSAATPKGLFTGGFGASQEPWPEKELKRLAEVRKAYGADTALAMEAMNNKTKLIGWGPALAKMAGINSPSVGGSFTQEQLEKEYGFTPVSKAASVGIKQLNGEVRKVALAEGSGTTGGYIVPPQFQTELLRIAAEDAVIERLARVLPMTSRTAQFPMLDVTTAQATGTSPYFGGVLATWQPEAATIDETEPAFRQGEWTAYDLVLYTVSSNQLLADNAVGLDSLLTSLFSEALTWYKEYAFFNGVGAGSSMPLGVLNAPATYVQSRSASNDFKLVDAASMMSRLHMRSWETSAWFMHPSVISKLIQQTNGATNSPFLVWLNPSPNDKAGPAGTKFPKAYLNGLPIYFTEKLPSLGTKGDVCLIDWSYYIIGQRLDLQIDVSPHYLFRNNQMAWRAVARLDGKPWLNSSITDANGWVSSPFVALAT